MALQAWGQLKYSIEVKKRSQTFTFQPRICLTKDSTKYLAFQYILKIVTLLPFDLLCPKII